MEILFTFNGTNEAIRAEQALLDAGLPVKVMSLPSSIRAGCGICLRVRPEEWEASRDALLRAKLPYDGLYARHPSPGGGSSTYTPFSP